MVNITETELEEVLNKFKDLVEGDRYTISSGENREKNDDFISNIDGIYPCGEGAGYAGGITSAAMDGIRVFEAIAKKYKSVV